MVLEISAGIRLYNIYAEDRGYIQKLYNIQIYRDLLRDYLMYRSLTIYPEII